MYQPRDPHYSLPAAKTFAQSLKGRFEAAVSASRHIADDAALESPPDPTTVVTLEHAVSSRTWARKQPPKISPRMFSKRTSRRRSCGSPRSDSSWINSARAGSLGRPSQLPSRLNCRAWCQTATKLRITPFAGFLMRRLGRTPEEGVEAEQVSSGTDDDVDRGEVNDPEHTSNGPEESWAADDVGVLTRNDERLENLAARDAAKESARRAMDAGQTNRKQAGCAPCSGVDSLLGSNLGPEEQESGQPPPALLSTSSRQALIHASRSYATGSTRPTGRPHLGNRASILFVGIFIRPHPNRTSASH